MYSYLNIFTRLCQLFLNNFLLCLISNKLCYLLSAIVIAKNWHIHKLQLICNVNIFFLQNIFINCCFFDHANIFKLKFLVVDETIVRKQLKKKKELQ